MIFSKVLIDATYLDRFHNQTVCPNFIRRLACSQTKIEQVNVVAS